MPTSRSSDRGLAYASPARLDRAHGIVVVLGLGLVLALLASPIAAAMAFLITYQEYQHHGFERRDLLRRSLRAAGVTFAFFALGALVVAWLLVRMLASG